MSTAERKPLRPDVFLSYARRDGTFVRQLADALEALGKDVWVDLDDIRKGADWHAKMLAGVESARVVVPVLSPDFADSKPCDEEVAHAIAHHKRLVPVLLRPVERGTLRGELTTPNWVLFDDPASFDERIEELVDATDADLDWLDEHARLLVRALEWDRAPQAAKRSLLLRGSDLRTAEEWLAVQGSHSTAATEEQTAYILASRHASERRRRITIGSIATALAVSVLLTVFALIQRHQAKVQADRSRSRELAVSAAAQLAVDPQLSLLLALEANRAARTPEAAAALRRATVVSKLRTVIRAPGVEQVLPALEGRRLVTAGAGVELRDLSGRVIRRLRGRAPAAAADLVATVSANAKRAWIWRASDGALLHTLRSPRGVLERAFFVDDGRRLVTASYAVFQLWDATSGALLRSIASGRPLDAVSADGRVAAVSKLQDVTNGDTVVDLHPLPFGKVRHLRHQVIGSAALSPDGSLLVVVDIFGTVHAIDTRTGERRRIARTPDSIPNSDAVHIAFDDTGRRVAVSIHPQFSESGGGATVIGHPTALVWDVQTDQVHRLKGHASLVASIAFSPDGSRVVTASDDKTARVWDAATGRQLLVLHGHDGPVLDATFAGPNRVVTASGDGTVRIWDVASLPLVRTFRGAAVAVSPDGGTVAVTERGRRRVTLRRTTSGRRLLTWRTRAYNTLLAGDGSAVAEDNGEGVTTVRRVAGGTALRVEGGFAALSADGKVALAGYSSAAAQSILRVGDRPVSHLANTSVTIASFSPDDRLLATAGGASLVMAAGQDPASVWDVESGHLVRRLGSNRYVFAVAFAPDGRHVATGGADGVVRLWDARGSASATTIGNAGGRVITLRFDDAGDRLAAVSRDTSARIWTMGAESAPIILNGHTDDVTGIAFSADGTLVVTSSEDGTARVWQAATGEPLLTIPGQSKAQAAPYARFTADGHVLVAPSERVLRVYACEVCVGTDDLVALAQRHVARPLTRAERRTFLHE